MMTASPTSAATVAGLTGGVAGLAAGAAARRLLARLRRGTRVRAPVCELAVGPMGVGTGSLWGSGRLPTAWLPAVLGLGWLGVAAGLVDARHRRLPDTLVVPATCFAPLSLLPMGLGAVGRGLLSAVAAVLGYGLVHLLRPAALGLGDVKLAAPLGAVLGAASWSALAIAAVLAAVITPASWRSCGCAWAVARRPGWCRTGRRCSRRPGWSVSCWHGGGYRRGPRRVGGSRRAALDHRGGVPRSRPRRRAGGLVAGVEITTTDIAAELARRRLGYGRGARMKFEADEVEVLGGVRHGLTQGGPVAVRIGNTEWPKWETVMAADPVDPELIASRARNAPLTRPRPGHADLAGMTKYGFDDARPVLERASARETAARVALGTVAQAFLEQALGVDDRVARRRARRGRGARRRPLPDPATCERVDATRCAPPTDEATAAMVAEVDAAQKDGDTLGGVVEVIAYGLPVGLGLVRAVGPPARRAARRRADGHPGDQGRRDRRRVPHRAPARHAAHDEMVPGDPVRRLPTGPAASRAA